MISLPASRAGAVVCGLALVACTAAPAPVAGPDPAAAAAACVAATAAHVGKPAEALTVASAEVEADGSGRVHVSDTSAAAGERVHLCEVRADGSVAALLHTAS